METAPQPEKVAPKEKVISEPYQKLVRDLFRKFRERPDQPKYSYADQHLLAEKSAETQEAFQKEKTETNRIAAEAAKDEFLNSKSDKKHISTVWTPLAAAKYYLESEESEIIPKEKREELIGKIENIYVDLDIARDKQNIDDELIEKVLRVMGEVEINLK